jgi:hypothetical protein
VQNARRDYTRRLAAGFALKAIYRVFRYRLELGQANEIREVITRLLNLSETVPALFSTFASFSKVLKVTCIGGKSWMKVA